MARALGAPVSHWKKSSQKLPGDWWAFSFQQFLREETE
jgi:hypothetical protein